MEPLVVEAFFAVFFAVVVQGHICAKLGSMRGNPGYFLMAHPLMEDEHFTRSVLLMTKWDAEQAEGLIINRISQYTLDQALKGTWPDWPLYLGGPVATDTLYYLHRRPDLIPNADQVGPDLFFGGDFEAVRSAVERGLIDSSEIRFMAGYAGWAPQQLEAELEQESWIVREPSALSSWWNREDLYRSWALEWPDQHKLWLNSPAEPHWN